MSLLSAPSRRPVIENSHASTALCYRDQLLRVHGLDATGIATAVLKRLATTHRHVR